MMDRTPQTLDEERQRFVFGATQWLSVGRYDKSEFQVDVGRHVQGVQSVDFVVLARPSVQPLTVMMLEVKDYRLKPVTAKHGDLAKEVAAKVHGTLAGLAAMGRQGQAAGDWLDAGKRACQARARLLVALSYESPHWHSTLDAKAELGVLQQQVQAECAWLSGVDVVVSSERVQGLPDVQVSTSP